jgi:hypothetical protein
MVSIPDLFTTLCQGMRVFGGSFDRAVATSREAPGFPSFLAIRPYEVMEPIGTEQTTV